MARVLGIAAIALATYLALQLFAGSTREAADSLRPELAAPAPASSDDAAPAASRSTRPPLVTDAVRERVNGYMAQEAARQPR